MYRIHFDPKVGKFVIQVAGFLGMWVTVHHTATEPQVTTGRVPALEFDTFAGAINHVNQIGLDKLYTDRSAQAFREYMHA